MTDSAPEPRLARPPGIHKWRAVAMPLGVALLYFSLRLPHLRNLPIFFDEAIYLRWAQIVAGDPAHRLFVTMGDGRAPLHVWLLALLLRIHSDPVMAGRLFSVVCGGGAVLAVLGLGREIAHHFAPTTDRLVVPSPPSTEGLRPHLHTTPLGLLAALLFLTSPFFMFYQRLAIAESLLLLEETLIVLLALRLVTVSATTARMWPYALALGLVFGCTLSTKQNFSYLLCAQAAWVGVCTLIAPPFRSMRTFRRWLSGFLLAAAIGIVLWIPMLLAPGAASLRARIFYNPVFLASSTGSARLSQIWNNISTVFIPRVLSPSQSSVDQSWLWIYLTPPVYILILIALIHLAWARRFRLLIFLMGWSASILASLVLIGSTLYPRYLTLSILPLFLALAWLLVDLGSWLARRASSRVTLATCASLGLLLICAWPIYDTMHDWNWRDTCLVTTDRWQYTTGWPCGYATQNAIAYLQENSRKAPAVVLTTRLAGVPDDALWLYLQNDPNIALFSASDVETKPVLQPGSSGGYMLRTDNCLPDPPQEVQLPPNAPIILVTRAPLYGKDAIKWPADFLQRLNPGTQLIQSYSNPTPPGSPFGPDNIVIFFIPRPAPSVNK